MKPSIMIGFAKILFPSSIISSAHSMLRIDRWPVSETTRRGKQPKKNLASFGSFLLVVSSQILLTQQSAYNENLREPTLFKLD